MTDKLARNVSIAATLFILAIGLVVYGIAIGKYRVWPYQVISDTHTVISSMRKFGEVVPENRLIPAPAHASRESVKIHNESALMDGLYAFIGWDDREKTYAVWLYNSKGERLYYWNYDYFALDPDGPLNHSDSPHAFAVLPDASYIVSFDEGDIMVRLDKCGDLIWSQNGVYHHSLKRDDEGNYWTWRGENTPYGHYQYLVKFDPESGETLKEIGLVEDLILSNPDDALLYGLRNDYKFQHFEKNPEQKARVDIFHPNDIDVLGSDLADNFRNFEAGDLLISFRSTHLVAVIDQLDYRVKWRGNGPWRFQHDPDFAADGTISVYNNNTGHSRSEILKVNVESGQVVNELKNGDQFFYSPYMGKHQYLPNGNVLITSPGEGRIIETDKSGNKVLEFNNLSTVSPDYNAYIANAVWLPVDYFQTPLECVHKD